MSVPVRTNAPVGQTMSSKCYSVLTRERSGREAEHRAPRPRRRAGGDESSIDLDELYRRVGRRHLDMTLVLSDVDGHPRPKPR